MSHATLIEDFGDPKKIEPGTWVRLKPESNWRRSHNICRVKVVRWRPRLKNYHVTTVDDGFSEKVIKPGEIEAVYVDEIAPTTRVELAAREYVLAKLDLREFESADPNNSARPWESLFYALDHAETRLLKELGL